MDKIIRYKLIEESMPISLISIIAILISKQNITNNISFNILQTNVLTTDLLYIILIR